MTPLEQAAQQALEALERIDTLRHVDVCELQIALRAALAQPAPSDNPKCKSVQKRLAIQRGEAAPTPERVPPADAITVNLMRLAGLDKHKARECEQIVLQVLRAHDTTPKE